MTDKITISWYADSRNLAANQNSIKLRVYVKGCKAPKYYSTHVVLTSDQWHIVQDKLCGKNISKKVIEATGLSMEQLEDSVYMLQEIENRAKSIMNNLYLSGGSYSLGDFHKLFVANKVSTKRLPLYDLLHEYLAEWEPQHGRPIAPKTKDLYNYAANSFAKYYAIRTGNKAEDISLYDITKEFLDGYKLNMNGRTCVDTYCRHIRAIFRYAIKKKYVSEEIFPFGKDKFGIQQAQGRHIALTDEDLEALIKGFNNPVLTDAEREAVGYILVSWYLNGCNPMDFLQFKFSKISTDISSFIRTKTLHTTRDKRPVPIEVSGRLRKLIEVLGNKPNPSKDIYIFPILSSEDESSNEAICNKVEKFRIRIHHNLKRAAKKLGITVPVNFDVIRHTFATLEYHHTKDLRQVSVDLGHTNLTTTQRYVESIIYPGKHLPSTDMRSKYEK